jgi:oligopeptide transport system substrate-binding protein
MMKKVGVMLLALVMLLGVLAGCSGSADEGKAGQQISVCVGSEPKSIDPTLNNAVDGATMIIHAFEGLTKLDKTGKVVPGMAKSWKQNDDGTVFTFTLRDAKWSDGQPVKAQDFVYSWRRAVDPATAAEYSYQLYYIKNGQAINEGNGKVEDLGVKAVDDKTLEVTLEAPCAYFLEITSFPTLFPIREDVVSKDPEGWATKPETYISNGPFTLKSWTHDSEIIMAKNESYYDKNTIKPSSVRFVLIGDANAVLAAFKNEEIIFADDMPTEEIPALKEEGVLKIDPLLGTYFYVFNTTKAPFDNPKVRKALTLAIDRQYIIDNIAQGNQIPAGAFVPYAVPDVKPDPDFRTTGKDYYDPSAGAYEKNIAEAKKLLEEAGYPNGQGFPQVEFMYNTEGAHVQIAEAIQEMWKKNLGITIKLTGQEWAVFQQTRTDGNFQIARHGWLGDYVDPMTFLDLWYSTSGQNDADWKNADFDKNIDIAKKSANREERMKAMHAAEDLMMAEMPVMPIYYYTDMYLIRDTLKGYYGSPLGFDYFMYSTIADK